MPTRQRPRSTSEAARRKPVPRLNGAARERPAQGTGTGSAGGRARAGETGNLASALPPHVLEHGPVRVAVCIGCGDRQGVYGDDTPRNWRIIRGRLVCRSCARGGR